MGLMVNADVGLGEAGVGHAGCGPGPSSAEPGEAGTAEARRGRRPLHGLRPSLPRPHPNDLVDWAHPNLPITDGAGPSRRDNRL